MKKVLVSIMALCFVGFSWVQSDASVSNIVGTSFIAVRAISGNWVDIPVTRGFLTSEIDKDSIKVMENCSHTQVWFRAKLTDKIKLKVKRKLNIDGNPVWVYERILINHENDSYCVTDEYILNGMFIVLYIGHDQYWTPIVDSRSITQAYKKIKEIWSE